MTDDEMDRFVSWDGLSTRVAIFRSGVLTNVLLDNLSDAEARRVIKGLTRWADEREKRYRNHQSEVAEVRFRAL